MYYIYKDDEIAVRKMEDCIDDYNLMVKWLSNPVVLEYYEGRNNPFDYDRVIHKFGPRAKGEEPVIPCILEYKERPIGYLQYFRIEAEEYKVSEIINLQTYSSPYGIDLFIGETNHWNKGVGTKLLLAGLRYLFEYENADVIFIDPLTSNKRAIRCYEKCGFKPVGIIENRELQEGKYKDSLIMLISASELCNR